MEKSNLRWEVDHINLWGYDPTHRYRKGEQVVVRNEIYASTIRDNIGNYPVGSSYWIKIN